MSKKKLKKKEHRKAVREERFKMKNDKRNAPPEKTTTE